MKETELRDAEVRQDVVAPLASNSDVYAAGLLLQREWKPSVISALHGAAVNGIGSNGFRVECNKDCPDGSERRFRIEGEASDVPAVSATSWGELAQVYYVLRRCDVLKGVPLRLVKYLGPAPSLGETSASLIVSRTPFRLSLGGGGTDLPAYYEKFGGFFVSAAVDKYMHIVLNDRFEPGIRLSYSKTEIVDTPEAVKHPLVREALKILKLKDRIEIVSLADVPAATGLGSSGSFTVGLLNALYAHQRIVKTPEEVAETACDIAMNRLHESSGKQDEYVASFGGVRAYEVDRGGKVTSSELDVSDHTLTELEYALMMFYTGITRHASENLGKQQRKVKQGDGMVVEKMHKIKRIGLESKKALEEGDLPRFGELLHEHWMLKRGITDSMSTSKVDSWYALARKNGAIGGKLVGAGGGGFLMLFCAEGREKVRNAMVAEGLQEMRFRFDFEGSKVIYNV